MESDQKCYVFLLLLEREKKLHYHMFYKFVKLIESDIYTYKRKYAAVSQ